MYETMDIVFALSSEIYEIKDEKLSKKAFFKTSFEKTPLNVSARAEARHAVAPMFFFRRFLKIHNRYGHHVFAKNCAGS